MDKYQSALYGERDIIFQTSVKIDETKKEVKVWKHELDRTANVFEVIQDDDITITKYRVAVLPHSFIEKVQYEKDGKRVDVPAKEFARSERLKSTAYSVIADFNDPIKKIRVVFKKKIADDLVIALKYVLGSVEAYNARKKKEKEKELMEKASIKHSVGEQLVNIYFQPCCKGAEKTEIELYTENGEEWQMMKRYSLGKDDMFLSVPGLAYGTYSYIVRQFDAKKKKFFESDRITFEIRRPSPGGRPDGKSAVRPRG